MCTVWLACHDEGMRRSLLLAVLVYGAGAALQVAVSLVSTVSDPLPVLVPVLALLTVPVSPTAARHWTRRWSVPSSRLATVTIGSPR